MIKMHGNLVQKLSLVFTRIAVLGLTVAFLFMWSPSVSATTIYRGVDKSSNTGFADLAPSQFKFSNGDMSTFEYPIEAPVQKPCQFSFDVKNGLVTGLPNFTATKDNKPEGHWNIKRPANLSDKEAGTEVSDYAKKEKASDHISPLSCRYYP